MQNEGSCDGAGALLDNCLCGGNLDEPARAETFDSGKALSLNHGFGNDQKRINLNLQSLSKILDHS